MENLQGNVEKPAGQKGKFSNSLNGLAWTPTPKLFFDLLSDEIITHIEFTGALAAWNYFQSSEIRGEEFNLSRTKLAALAGIGERQAGQIIRRLEALGLIKRVFWRNGVVNKLAWNVDRFRDLNFYLYPSGTGTCTPEIQHLYPTGTAPVPQRYIVYIYKLLKHIKRFNTLVSASSSSVDNSKEEFSAGQDCPSISENKKDAATIAAIARHWALLSRSTKHPTYDLHEIYFIIMANLKRLVDSANFAEELETLLTMESFDELQNEKNNHFKTEAELFESLKQLETMEVSQ